MIPYKEQYTKEQLEMLRRLEDAQLVYHPSDKVLKRFRMWWVQDCKCFWCGGIMTFGKYPNGAIPPTEATIEHLDSRLSNTRGAYIRCKGKIIRLVAAHSRCNHEKGLQDEEKYRDNIRRKQK